MMAKPKKPNKQASVRQLIAQLDTRVTALEAIQASPSSPSPTPEPEAPAEEQPKKHWYS